MCCCAFSVFSIHVIIQTGSDGPLFSYHKPVILSEIREILYLLTVSLCHRQTGSRSLHVGHCGGCRPERRSDTPCDYPESPALFKRHRCGTAVAREWRLDGGARWGPPGGLPAGQEPARHREDADKNTHMFTAGRGHSVSQSVGSETAKGSKTCKHTRTHTHRQ